ncbi:MAG TPA: glycosyl hydrolase family 18 protein, partial [Sphingomicrobium sp.]|nr:glycosyl hydrolase family 18 protein [Sphingomicrobium sp.]
MVERPIFYDPSGQRRKRFKLAIALFALLVILAATALFATLVVGSPEPPLPVALEHGAPLPPPRTTLISRAGKQINRAIANLLGTKPPSPRKASTIKAFAAAGQSQPLTVGFYVPWDESSTASLQRHIGDLDWLAPMWVTVVGPQHRFNVTPDPDARAVIDSAPNRPLLLPVVQNYANGQADPAGAEALLADPRLRKAFLDRFEAFLLSVHASGAVFDFEELDPVGRAHYLQLLQEARRRFAPRKWLVTVAVPVGENWNLPAFAAVSDKLFLMAYDEHS